MRRGYKCILTSKSTGEKLDFKIAREASDFLQRTRTYVSSCMYNGFAMTHAVTGEKYTCKYRKPRGGIPTHKPHKDQPCWTCTKSCGGCSWSARFEPVEGWEAKETAIHHGFYHGKARDEASYAIIRCPEYERG